MNKNKKIISASLALALGVSLIIPNAKANEEKSVENALKEPVKTSEKVKTEEKSTVEDKKITINKAPLKEGETEAGKEEIEAGKEEIETGKEEIETGKEETEAGKKETEAGKEETEAGKEEIESGKKETEAGKEETGAGKEETGAGKEETETDKTEDQKTDEEEQKDEKKVKPKEYKMSELLNEKGAFEKIKGAELDFLLYQIWNEEHTENREDDEYLIKSKLKYEQLQKATTWEEMAEILGYHKEYFARSLLSMKGEIDAYDQELVKIIDDMANQKPQNPSQKNTNRKNKKTGTTNTTNTSNTGNKVSNAGENVQTGVGSLSAILGLLGASSLGLFKSRRK